MGLFKKLFGGSKKQNTIPQSDGPHSSHDGKNLSERDNVGLRCETAGEGEAYFLTLFQKDPEPFIFYFFDNRKKAETALADTSCVGIAKDSGKLVCTQMLTFGVFPAEGFDGSKTWAALLAGKNLTHDIWIEAQRCFKDHGGVARREEEPLESESPSISNDSQGDDDPKFVEFSYESKEEVSGFPAIRRFYKAPSKASAIAWLKQNPVHEQSFFLIVETPEGEVARDLQGIFEP